ncbi:alpha-galactosidase [Glycomyces sp. L485]|uniref:alpha-galactosidase n=1 Tax=Glycomyces sp. L485 TaxID=2909235 RepID=UPI001F4B8AF8|nr:alpha-galactosidase [Glycomyces sp. L485]MCH7231214.1 alpha-galactosidase [Glycomyces sp. L485]
MTISFDEAAGAWHLSGPGHSYVVGLCDQGMPRQYYWGPPIPDGAVAGLLRDRGEEYSFDDRIHNGVELLGELGPQFATPSLQLRHPDGAKGFAWNYRDHTVDGDHLAIVFTDRELALTLHYRIWNTGVIDRWAVLETGAPVEIGRFDSAAWTLPHWKDYRLSHLSGEWAAEWQLRRVELPVGETLLGSRRGNTSHQANPWCLIDDGTATETGGEVYSSALAWSGSWRVQIRRSTQGRLTLTGGAGQEGLRWHLEAGEAWETPVYSAHYSADGFGGASRAWHEHLRRHVMPTAEEDAPVLFNSWEAVTFDVSEKKQMPLVDLAARIGCEQFVIDDAWFGSRTSDTAGLGDWWPNPDRFPNGLKPLIDAVHAKGMKFGLWIEPEMVNPDSDLYRAHPDWAIHQTGRDRTELRAQLVLDYSRAEVAAWAFATLDKLLGDNDIDFLKWDHNRPFTEVGRPDGTDPDRVYIDHVKAVYELKRKLREAHPHVRIEGCAGGAARVDPGILRYVDQVWTSDNTDAGDRVAIQHGFSQAYPARAMGAWVTDVPNPFTRRVTTLRFRFQVAGAGLLAVGGDLSEWSDAELDEAAEHVAVYKDIRAVVQHGAQYRLGDPETEQLTGVQYVLGDRIVVLAFKTPSRFNRPQAPLRPAAVAAGSRWVDEDTGEIHWGAGLHAHGLPLRWADTDWDSAILRLRRAE